MTRASMPVRAWRAWLLGTALAAACAVQPALAGPAEDSEQAEKDFARGDLVNSLTLWRKAANAGYAPAQARLGDILDKAEEDEEAVQWYRKSAAQGNAAGEYGLGQMYGKGEGVKQDLAEARRLTLVAAEKGHIPAMLQAIDIYRSGAFGGTLDKAKADEWEARAKKALGVENVPPPQVEPVKKGKKK